MENVDKNSESYQRAKKRVRERKDYYYHLAAYAGVNVTLFIINAVTSPGAWWFYWVTIFWGIGLVWHTIAFFIMDRMEGDSWEERKIREEMEKEKRKENK